MTARATFTQAQLTRAIRAAEAAGKVAIYTAAGIAFVDPAEDFLNRAKSTACSPK